MEPGFAHITASADRMTCVFLVLDEGRLLLRLQLLSAGERTWCESSHQRSIQSSYSSDALAVMCCSVGTCLCAQAHHASEDVLCKPSRTHLIDFACLQTSSEVKVQANVPGVSKDDIVIEIHDSMLNIKVPSIETPVAAGGSVIDSAALCEAEAAEDDVATGAPVDGEQSGEKGAGSGVKWHLRERDAVAIDREIELPESTDTSNVAATCEDGVLTIVFGKKQLASNVKRVKVA